MLGEKFGHFCLNRLRQQGTRSVAQHLGERVSKRPWLKQLDHGSIGHGVSLLCWRSGGSNTPTIRRLLPVRPSPTSAYSSSIGFGNLSTSPKRRSTLSIIRSRMSELSMPPVVATQEIASRSQQSSVKAMRPFSPLSQPISNPSEHHRVSERSTAIRPSCRRSSPLPVCRGARKR